MIQELNDAECNRSAAVNAMSQPHEQELSLAAFRPQANRAGRGRPTQFNPNRRPSCHVCRAAGRPAAIVNSHSSANCRLKDALLNVASVPDELTQEQDLPFAAPLEDDEELVQ